MILVAGEALYDLVVAGDDVLHAHAGGGPFNVARTLGRLERPVAFLGRVSGDRFGRRLSKALADDGVDLSCVVDTDDPTTLALAETDAAGNARYGFYDVGTSAPGLTADEALGAVGSRMLDVLHVGTLGLVFEPMAGALEAVVGSVGPDVLVVVDPNCRPSAMREPDAYRARLGRVLARADVVKVSEDDMAWLDPGREPVEAARALLAGGAAVALLTRGPDGAVVVFPDRELVVPAVDADVVDTIGAGDALGGGFVAWWHERGLGRAELHDAARVVEATHFAARVAARTVERAGASPPRRSELT